MKNSAAVPSGAWAKRRVRNFIRRSFVARRGGYCQAAPALLAASMPTARSPARRDARSSSLVRNVLRLLQCRLAGRAHEDAIDVIDQCPVYLRLSLHPFPFQIGLEGGPN